MKKYIYVRAYTSSPTVWSTDPNIPDWIFQEIKKRIDTCESKPSMELFNLTGARIGFILHKLDKRKLEVASWIHKMLCESGFEPFTVSGDGDRFLAFIHFRKEIE